MKKRSLRKFSTLFSQDSKKQVKRQLSNKSLNKKGMAHHIEMMISFTMFIFFIFFVMLFVRPHDNSFLSESVVSGAHHNLLQSARTDVVMFFVDVDTFVSSGKECVRLQVPPELAAGLQDSSVSLGYLSDDPVATDLVRNANSVVVGISHGRGNNSYYVHLSEDVSSDSLTGCNFYADTEYAYTFGSFRRNEVISFLRLEEIQDEYRSDYEGLRIRLGIPESFDYAITAPDITMVKNIPTGADVLAKDYIEKVMYPDGRIKYERISIKLWR